MAKPASPDGTSLCRVMYDGQAQTSVVVFTASLATGHIYNVTVFYFNLLTATNIMKCRSVMAAPKEMDE